MYRTNDCNSLRASDVGKKVTLAGWVHRRRDHGNIIFVDIRDRYGLVQVVSDPIKFPDAHKQFEAVRSEFVIQVEGEVCPRMKGHENPEMETGEIEVVAHKFVILNESKTPPFEIDQEKEVNEEIRLKYRYLDLRRNRLKSNIILRHKMIKFIRDFLDLERFIEVETPILIKGTPEGSREYLVPSRIYPGTFYVLPQSPQQLKQLLMVAGFDRYFQIARCFRDEDQRGDRQPEFTQLDVEMSFVEMDDVMQINEKLLMGLVKNFAPEKKIKETPFPVLTYEEAMNLYGSDKPDLRYDFPLSDVTDIVSDSGFSVFSSAVQSGGVVKALKIDGGGSFTRKDIDELTDIAKVYKAKGLAYVIVEKDGPKSPILKFLGEEKMKEILERCDAKEGDIVFFTADKFEIACESLGHVRQAVAKKMDLIDENLFSFCWVKEFPMFALDEETGKLDAVHHPFTAPLDPSVLKDNPEKAIAKAYDIALNGNEIAGGSIRIHEEEVQKIVFDKMNITPENAERKFGHMLEAFTYGAPPHGGIAWGIDRLIMIFANEPNIREVIAFPKDQKAKDLMLGAPSEMPKEQLEELHIKVEVKED